MTAKDLKELKYQLTEDEASDLSYGYFKMATVKELLEENEKLNHYKLLYQKVKDRNDKAIEYVENNTYTSAGSLKTTLYLQNDELYDFLEILKGESNE